MDLQERYGGAKSTVPEEKNTNLRLHSQNNQIAFRQRAGNMEIKTVCCGLEFGMQSALY